MRRLILCRSRLLGQGPILVATVLAIGTLTYFFVYCFYFEKVEKKGLSWSEPNIYIVPMGIYALFLLMSLWSLFTAAFSNPGYTLDYFVFKRIN